VLLSDGLDTRCCKILDPPPWKVSHLWESQMSVLGKRVSRGPHSRNFPQRFSKDLPMSDDLGISKKFSFLNSWRLTLRFRRGSPFLFNQSDALIQTTWSKHPSLKTFWKKSWKTFYLDTPMDQNIICTSFHPLSWPNAKLLYLLIANLTAVWRHIWRLHLVSTWLTFVNISLLLLSFLL